MDYYGSILLFLGHLILCWFCVRFTKNYLRQILFFAINLLGFAAIYIYPVTGMVVVRFCIYLVAVLSQYFLVQLVGKANTRWQGAPVIFPLVLLIIAYTLRAGEPPLDWRPKYMVHMWFLGFSFMAFRMVLYATEMSEQKISKATFLEYCNYCFFYPAITVGPITRPSAFIAGLRGPSVMTGNVIDSLLRVFIGGFKYYFLGPIVGRFSVTEFAIGYAAISAVQFLILGVGSLLHLYCNFSGLCDIAVGTANVLGLPFDENFFNPFSSRSVSQFWQRWHMTLSRFLRELMFLPLTRIYQSILGVRHLDFAVNLSIVSTFAVIGIWHGLKANYLVFGLLHGFAVVIENRGSQMLRMLFPNRKLESVVGARLGAVLPQLLTMGFVSISQLAFLLPIEKWSLVLKHLLCFF